MTTEAATSYTTERDSLWQRAGRVRALTQARIAVFRQSSFAVRGTRRTVESYAATRATNNSHTVHYVRIKREISNAKPLGQSWKSVFIMG